MGLLASPSAPTQAPGQPKAGLLNRAPAQKPGLLNRTQPSGGGTIKSLDDFKTRLASVESGGKYDALGPVLNSGMYAGDRAYGKYQVMGKNLDQWGKQYLGRPVTPQEYLANPDLQETLITKRFNELYSKYGNWDDVASVHFTGRPRAVAGDDVKDALGTTSGEYVSRVTGAPQGGATANLIQDTLLGLPKAAVKVAGDIGKGFAQAGGKALQAYSALAAPLHKLGSVPLDLINPGGKAARDEARKSLVLTPQGQFQEDLYAVGTEADRVKQFEEQNKMSVVPGTPLYDEARSVKPITPQSVAADLGIDPKNPIAAPVGIAIGALDLIPGGNLTKTAAVQALKNANKAADAVKVLTRILGMSTEVARKYADDAARATDEVQLGTLVDNALKESADFVEQTKRAGSGLKNLFQGGTKQYQTIHQGGEIKMVEGEPVQIVDGVETFAHQGDGGWVVSEASTGRFLAESRTKEAAIAKARAAINEVGEEKFRSMLQTNQLPTAKNAPPVQEGRIDLPPEPEVPVRSLPDSDLTEVQRGVSLLDDASTLQNVKGVNVDLLNISDEGKDVIRRVAEEIRPRLAEKIGSTLKNDEVVKMAEGTGRVLTRAVGKDETADWSAAMLRARQRLASATESGTIDRDYIENLLAIKTQGTDIARKLQSLSIKADARTTTQKEIILDAVLKVNENVDDILKAAEGVDFNDLKQATAFYRKFVQPTAMEWVDLVRYNSMLSSPKTHILNALGGNLPNSLLIAPIQKAVQGGLDFLKSAFTGRERQYFAGEAGSYVKNYFKGIGEAAHRFADVMAGKKGFTDKDLRTIPVASGGVKGAVADTLSIPMKLLEASDQFFTALVESGEMGALKYRAAKGVKGLGNLEERAQNAATYRLFRQDPGSVEQGTLLDAVDGLTNVLQMARNSENPILSTIAKFTLPFVRTPTNIFKQGIEYSPLGFANLIGVKKGGKLGLAGDVNEQLSKAIIGSAVFAGAATMLMSNRLTWAEPTGERRNEFRALGMQPYSVKIGDTWYSYQKLPPAIAFPFAMVAAIDDSLKARTIDESTADVVLGFIGNYANFLKDQSYVKSIGDIINGEYGLEGVVSNYAQQLVPFRALGGWLARLTDHTQRQIDRDDSFIGQQVQQLMMNIPGLSDDLPARLDPQGNPIPQASPIGNAFSPVPFKNQTPEQSAEYRELEDIRLRGRNSGVLNDELTLQAEEIARKAMGMPKEEAIAYLNEVAGGNPQLADKVKSEIKSLKNGLTPTEKAIKALGVADGSRARYIADKVRQMATREEKIAYLESLQAKGIISADVKRQIQALMQQ